MASTSSTGLSPAVLLSHSLAGSSAVRCISVLHNAVICACNDGSVHRVPFMVIHCSYVCLEFLLQIKLFSQTAVQTTGSCIVFCCCDAEAFNLWSSLLFSSRAIVSGIHCPPDYPRDPVLSIALFTTLPLCSLLISMIQCIRNCLCLCTV